MEEGGQTKANTRLAHTYTIPELDARVECRGVFNIRLVLRGSLAQRLAPMRMITLDSVAACHYNPLR